jgi:hypothetical protein
VFTGDGLGIEHALEQLKSCKGRTPGECDPAWQSQQSWLSDHLRLARNDEAGFGDCRPALKSSLRHGLIALTCQAVPIFS